MAFRRSGVRPSLAPPRFQANLGSPAQDDGRRPGSPRPFTYPQNARKAQQIGVFLRFSPARTFGGMVGPALPKKVGENLENAPKRPRNMVSLSKTGQLTFFAKCPCLLVVPSNRTQKREAPGISVGADTAARRHEHRRRASFPGRLRPPMRIRAAGELALLGPCARRSGAAARRPAPKGRRGAPRPTSRSPGPDDAATAPH